MKEILDGRDWLLAEDFNEIRVPEGRADHGQFDVASVQEFNNAVRGLIELESIVGFFYLVKWAELQHTYTKLD